MPSDPLPSAIQSALAPHFDAFRSAVAGTSEQIRSSLAELDSDVGSRLAREEAGLGGFADGCIDVERFAALATGQSKLTAGAKPTLEAAQKVLMEINQAGAELNQLRFDGGDLLQEVHAALASVGRAFGAARVAELARTGSFRKKEHGGLLKAYPYPQWNARERRLAPPLVIHCSGKDLHAGALSLFLDGDAKLVLVVDGVCPPALLARLISPGIFVVQGDESAPLEAMLAWKGPGIAALVHDQAARFVHDPEGGASIAERLRLDFLPEAPKPRALGGLSAGQQLEDLQHLTALAGSAAAPAPASIPANGAASAPATPVDKLAAFLLARAHLDQE